MVKKWQVHRASFKAKVALAALRGEGTPSTASAHSWAV